MNDGTGSKQSKSNDKSDTNVLSVYALVNLGQELYNVPSAPVPGRLKPPGGKRKRKAVSASLIYLNLLQERTNQCFVSHTCYLL